ncbi:MAG TPA: oligopeptide ABC transporter permease [Longimicrobium sp.]|nr:oligopeptide ABC transporter permease [Longimicrobium sp.]
MRASPDVESVPPEPMPPALPPQSSAAPVAAGGVAWARVTTLVLAWGFFFSLLFLGWARIRGIAGMERVGVDMWIALATLALTVGLLLRWTWRSVSPAHLARGRIKGDSQWAIAGRHFKKNKLAIGGLIVMIILYLVTLLTPLIAPFDPAAQGDIITSRYLPPSAEHWLGTDKFGRDILSRTLYGARISLSIGFVAVGISITLGTLIGALAGYFGGWVDAVLMRFTDMMLAFPRLVLLIVVIAVFESPSIWLVVVVLGLTGWMATSRIVRGEVLSLREREFVQAARALGMGDTRIILRHVIPNTMAPVIVSATLGIGLTILTEASLSFLGLGVQPPTASWGNMVADGRDALTEAWWIATFPGLAIVLTVVAFNLLGDGLRDALDPRLRT